MPRRKKTDIERSETSFPRVPCTKQERLDLARLAGKRGFGKKMAPYIRECALKETPGDLGGMPIDDVMRGLSLVGRSKGLAVGNPALQENLDELAKLFMNVIRPT